MNVVGHVCIYGYQNITQIEILCRKVLETEAWESGINHVSLLISGRRMWQRGIRWQKKR